MERLNLRLCLGAATLVCVTAGLCFAITATTGFAARTFKSVRIPLYTNAVFPGAALTCTMGIHRKGYRLVFCRRFAGVEGGIWVTFTSSRVQVWKEPQHRLLYSRARNP